MAEINLVHITGEKDGKEFIVKTPYQSFTFVSYISFQRVTFEKYSKHFTVHVKIKGVQLLKAALL